MKKAFTPSTLVILTSLFIFTACGEDSASDSASGEGNSAKVEPAKKILTPMNASEYEPIDAELLMNTWNVWEGKTVQVVGYLDLFTDNSPLYFASLKLLGAPGSEKVLVDAEMTEKDSTIYQINTPVLIEGKIQGYWGFDGKYSVRLTETKIVKKNPPIPTEKILDPENLKNPVTAQALWDNYVAWIDKEITVIGNANGVTTSTTDYGVTIRVDLTKPGSYLPKFCGVRVIDSTHAQSTKEKSGVMRKFRGKFVGECFGYVCIEDAIEIK